MYKKKIIPIRSMAASFCQIQKYQESEREVHIFARSVCRTAACPRCDHISSHLHATYQRIIQTLPVHGKYTCLHVTAYKYNCVNSTCSQKVFMESLPFAAPSQVRTNDLTALILAASVFLSDDGVSRVLETAGIRVSNDTVRRISTSFLCRLPSSLPDRRSCRGFSPAERRRGEQLAEQLQNRKKIRLSRPGAARYYGERIGDILPAPLLHAGNFCALRYFLEQMMKIFPCSF